MLLNTALSRQAQAKPSEELLNLINRRYKGNPIYKGKLPRTTTQKAAGILYVDQATAINAKLDTM